VTVKFEVKIVPDIRDKTDIWV